MRDYKFRAKRIDTGEWVYGFLFELSYDGSSVLCIGTEPLSANDYSEIYKSCYEEVDPSTICQFTGLLDKNGVEIYENDVIKYEYYRDYGQSGEYVPREAVVQWNPKKAGFEPLSFFANTYHYEIGRVEVIGTIHDAQGGESCPLDINRPENYPCARGDADCDVCKSQQGGEAQ